MLFRNICKTWIPAMYQGKHMMKGYFEGWYYKIADKNEQHIGALIPGISYDKDRKKSHCFIQFLDDSGNLSNYFLYDINEFSYSPDKPEIKIGESFFSPTMINVDINDQYNSIKGILTFQNLKPWPVSIFLPGAMGWYAFVPFMECYHGVLSFDHMIEGQLKINGELIDFTGGKGYTEKDWGRSFPSYHIWIQTNHFDEPGTSIMVSIANIPWLGKSFDGFIIGFLYHDCLYKFTTYTGAKITEFNYDKAKLTIHTQLKSYRLEISVPYTKGIELRTPVSGEMQGRLSESLKAMTEVKFFRKSKNTESLIFTGIGRHTGLEIEGELPAVLNL